MAEVPPTISKPAPARGRDAAEAPAPTRRVTRALVPSPTLNFSNFCGDPAAMADIAGIGLVPVPLADDRPASLGGEIRLAA